MAIRKLYSIFTISCEDDTKISKSLNLSEYDYYEELFDELELESRFLMLHDYVDDIDEDLEDTAQITFDFALSIKDDIKRKIKSTLNEISVYYDYIIEVFIINEERELEELDIIEEAWKAIEWYYNNRNNE
jgi:hypothetical protein